MAIWKARSSNGEEGDKNCLHSDNGQDQDKLTALGGMNCTERIFIYLLLGKGIAGYVDRHQ